jgi:hypothetical protein
LFDIYQFSTLFFLLRNRDELPSYRLLHSAWFNTIELLLSLLTLWLGFFEDRSHEARILSLVEAVLLLLLTILWRLKTR